MKVLNVWMNTDIFVGENNKADQDQAGRESRKKGTTNQGRGVKKSNLAGYRYKVEWVYMGNFGFCFKVLAPSGCWV